VTSTSSTNYLRIAPSTGSGSAPLANALCVAPGETASFGRFKDRCTLAIADRWVAPVHFEIRSEDQAYVVRDLSGALSKHQSCEQRCFLEELRNTKCSELLCAAYNISGRTGLYLNGQRVEEATLRNADVLVAGQTSFQVTIQAQPFEGNAAASKANRQAGLTSQQRERVLDGLDHAGVYALLDAARGPSARALRLQYPEVSYSLYDGPDVERFVEVAPYLIKIGERSSPLLETWLSEHWGQAYGYFIISDAPFKVLRRHLRKFLKVDSSQGRRMYFRFYDPRVIRTFLPTCAPTELVDFFGPISHLIVESEQAHTALRFHAGESGLRTELMHLDGGARTSEPGT
jgi:pSer/pThr/pTyr-binding forkhead associated (FHA) protein